ncbi:rhodanese-like domain-containing protein [Teredinibacter haidensis]|mgnify:CR=1 FL=1|uniref:rhodanese-like domain-containing protein n=1 Tax=Teredinibacter haidensis TaxID=2731755 RepID=UPI000948DC1F|nr:rhodanese-like domain-containing protein [Teredinibacter haidensis]
MVFIGDQWILVSIVSVLAAALIVVEGRKGGKALSHHEITRLVNSGDAVIVDVRESKEFNAGHIVDAINIPHVKLADRASELEKHRAKTLIVVDKMGQHAGASGKALKDKGFIVTRMQGGMSEWQNQNLPVVKG